jgi:hypothetical protein
MNDEEDKVNYFIMVICELFSDLKWVFVCYKNVLQLQFIAVCMSEKMQCAYMNSCGFTI